MQNCIITCQQAPVLDQKVSHTSDLQILCMLLVSEARMGKTLYDMDLDHL